MSIKSTKSLFVLSILLINATGIKLPHNYHGRVGIKLAEEVRKLEVEGRTSRIVGGTEVPEDSLIPYQAGIIIILESGWTSICGGALVSNTKVLTAAHCWNDGQDQARVFTVVLGAQQLFFDGLRLVTTTVEAHPQWNTFEHTYDIAVVTLPEVQLSDNIRPISLPVVSSNDYDEEPDYSGLTGTLSGYGKSSDTQNSILITTTLHRATVTVITDEECQMSFRASRFFIPQTGQFCTSGMGGLGVCEGDYGAPLVAVVDNVETLIGIASFELGEQCEANLPTVFTKIITFVDWIQERL